MPEFSYRGKTYINPVEFALDMIGGKWKMPILWRLRENTLRYSELKKELPGITHKMLASQLRELEENGFVDRKVYPVVPPKTEYSLTTRGKKCLPVIEALRKYGNELKKDLKVESPPM